ncbi:MAG: hypothetical protein V1875_06125 [Candidatus Altiarchaeota archaeon]
MKVDDVIALLKQAKVEEALEAIEKVDDRKEMAHKLTEFAAALNYLKGLPQLSEALLRRSIRLDTDNPHTYFNLGVLYTNIDAPDKGGRNAELSERAYKKALSLKSDFHEARYNLALIYYFTDRIDDARREYGLIQEAIGDDPGFRDLGIMLLEEDRLAAI